MRNRLSAVVLSGLLVLGVAACDDAADTETDPAGAVDPAADPALEETLPADPAADPALSDPAAEEPMLEETE